MIAGSILMGRALAPIELGLGQWALVQRALKGWHSLAELLDKVPEEKRLRTALPKPKALLEVQGLAVVPPGSNRAAAAQREFPGAAGTGDRGDRAFGIRQVNAGAGADRCLAACGRLGAARWRVAGSIRTGCAGRPHRLLAAAGAGV